MTKAGTSSDSCGSLVVQCDLVSPDEIFGNLSSSFPQQERYPGDNNISPSPSSQTMDAFRLVIISNKYNKTHLSNQAMQDLLQPHLEPTETKKGYRKN
ncbi:hypothetical protein G6F70_007881 [Rhizopus microsporus]|nr:hypothetical protein G6F71_007872 [Rhizopus microsporus]KAG1195890.1 hypothetical protein G6F70_007881 [Rhizopus microsporus]KAG1207740.1 hypothetical protein G6F69_007792 [Rhizopus microsporus]KAG1228661.1 hypothetical protein G6F67_007673 [Rhizopus microsporus]KAG1262609.1 hypothetical protein G6F68_005814 [Rhizopus microsporus]